MGQSGQSLAPALRFSTESVLSPHCDQNPFFIAMGKLCDTLANPDLTEVSQVICLEGFLYPWPSGARAHKTAAFRA